MIEKETLIQAIKEAGIEKGDLLNLKVSLKSIGKISGGPQTLIDAFLDVVGEEGTLVSDAFVETQFKSENQRKVVNDDTPSYAGAVANTMIKHPDSYRSKHPIQKFIAIGREARKLTENHKKGDFAYGVLKEMVNKKGKNIKIGPEEKVPGVGTTHIVLCEEGFEQDKIKKGVYYENKEGQIQFFEVNWVGGCGFGFNNLMPLFKKKGAVLADVPIGNTRLKVTDLEQTYAIEKKHLKEDPTSILCDDPGCISCRLSWSFSDTSYFKFILQHLFRGKFKKALGAFYYKINSRKVKGQENINFK